MKKLFLIPLMAMLCTVMAWAATVQVNDYTTLKNAINNASNGDVIEFTQNIEYETNDVSNAYLNIKKSITINGKGFSLTGYGKRGNTARPTIAINQDGSEWVAVTIKNLKIFNDKYSTINGEARPIECRGKITSLTLDSVDIKCTNTGNHQGITLGGRQSSLAQLTISNTTIDVGNSGYPILSFNPYNGVFTNCSTIGYAALYFKGDVSSEGSHGTSVLATNCTFYAHNEHNGNSDNFGAFVLEDEGINLTLDNCNVDCTMEGTADQAVFCLSDWTTRESYAEACEFTVKGASTEILGNILTNKWTGTPYEVPVTFFFYGGTYNDNIEDKITNGIPTGFHVNALPTVKDGEPITLYRVVKDAATHEVTDPEDPSQTIEVLYDLNDAVETTAEGENPATSFDLSTGTDMTLNNETTTAGYVQISDNVTTDPISGDPVVQPTTVTVGKTAGGDDQTLIISSGLDVQGESQVVVEPGATLQIGEGGVTTEDPENIVIEANENGAASFLLNPEVIVNNTPELTVKMKAKQIGRNAEGQFMWHRFAMPVAHIDNWEKKGSLVAADGYAGGVVKYPTYLYGWDYANNDWANIVVGNMVPLQGYTLTLASDYIHLDGEGKVDDESQANGNLNVLQDVTYIFKGNLVGNTNQPLNFSAEGFNFFGNSYTGYIDVLTLIGGFVSNNVEGTVYMWCNDPTDEKYQSYVGVSLYSLQNLSMFLEDWQKEVAPMQTFILRLRGADSADETVDYASAIWGNPRYGNNTASPAPRRVVATNNIESHMAIVVKANGKGSRVEFTQDANYTDAFENGCDVVKYMNENTINLYATVNGEDLSSVVTNSLNGKLLSLQTNNEVNYTMSFKNVAGTTYAILDHATNQMTVIAEGNTYQFAAQPNSTVEGRFEIVPIQNMPTAVETVETTATVKGIYTIMGQYVGEDFESLPAGVYVVDGVKIVK